MGFHRNFVLALMLTLGSLACQAKQEEDTGSAEAAAAESASCQQGSPSEDCPAASDETKKPSNQVNAPKPKILLTCGQQGIPSWQSSIADLTSARCEKCHSTKLSYLGVLLTNYQEFVKNWEKAKGRIQTNSLTEPLDPVEQRFYMDFFKAGMPEKESDCKQPDSPP